MSAGDSHAVLLRSDGQVVACGKNDHGQCHIPHLAVGRAYVQVSAGDVHTVLLRTDGQAVAFGSNEFGQCAIPELADGLTYVPDLLLKRLVQVFCKIVGDRRILFTCVALSGEELCTVTLHETDLVGRLRSAAEIAVRQPYLSLALPNGFLLSSMPASTSVSELLDICSNPRKKVRTS